MDELVQDIRYAVRGLLRKPTFTAVLVLTLGLGIGASTAVFSVVEGVLLRPLPYPEPDRLAVVWSQFPEQDLMEFGSSWPEYVDFRDQQGAFVHVGAWRGAERTLTGGDGPERIDVTAFTWSMWSVLGVDPLAGRVFTADEDLAGRDDVVVLSHGLWTRRFGADPEILGRSIELDGRAIDVIGVMPADFDFRVNGGAEAWIPMGIDPGNPPGRGNHFASIAGRLADGVSFEQARAEMRTILDRWGQDEAIGHTWRAPNHPAFLRPLHDQIVGDVRTSLVILLGAVGFVLLIACANVANLLLVRGESRQREIAIRTSMGAGQPRIVRQLVTESLVMAVAGGVSGLLLAYGGLIALLSAAPSTLPRLHEVGLNPSVLAFSAGVTILSGVLFGLAPALQSSRNDVQGVLREESRGGTASRRRFRFRHLLVVSEMSLAVVLLIAAALLMQSFWRLQNVDPGFRGDGLITMSVNAPASSYPEQEDVTAFYRDVIPRLAALPGVTLATAVRTPPLSGNLPPNDLDIEGYEAVEDVGPLNADIQVVAPGYFEAMGIPVLRGRSFEDRDQMDGEIVGVIDEVLAERFFPGQDPVGRRIRQSFAEWSTIIGVVGAVRQQRLDIEPRAHFYLVHAQTPATWSARRDMNLLLKTDVDPLGLVAGAREVVRTMDPDLPLFDVTTMEATRSLSTANERFSMFLQLVFAGVALTLAVVGIYGVLSFSVAQRTREIGIRMALGAQGGSIARMVTHQGLVLVFVAVGVGIVGSLFVGQVLAGLLYEIGPRDPATYGAVAIVLTIVGAFACYLPARRASGVAPQTALRSD